MAILFGELRQARGIAIDNGSRRNPVDESSLANACVRKRARERRRSRRDHLRYAHSAALDLSHNFQQVVVAVVRRLGPFALFQSAILAVVVVQAAELQAVGANRAGQRENFVTFALLDASAVHAGIYVEKNSRAAAAPLPHLFFVLGQGGNAHLRELLRYFPHSARICPYRWIG